MFAKVKPDSPIRIVTAFGGFSYNPREWMAVPAGCEEEAKKHPYLDTVESLTVTENDEITAVFDVPAEMLEPEKVPKRRRRNA